MSPETADARSSGLAPVVRLVVITKMRPFLCSSSPKKPFPPAGSCWLVHVCVGGIRKSCAAVSFPWGQRALQHTHAGTHLQRRCERSQTPARHASPQDCACSVNSSPGNDRIQNQTFIQIFLAAGTRREEEAQVPGAWARAPFLTEPLLGISTMFPLIVGAAAAFPLILLPDFGRLSGLDRVCFFFRPCV